MSDDKLQLASNDEAQIEAILRSMSAADLELDTPPASLWDDIDAALRADEPPTVVAPTPEAKVIDLTSRFRRNTTGFIAAAAAAVVVIVGAVTLVVSGGDDTIEVVGEAQLVWDAGFVEEGTDVVVDAAILADDDGQAVRIDDAALPTRSDEDLELWLIGVDAEGELTIQTLGVIDDASAPGTYDVPDEFDPDAYETVLVDISFEPRDGVETHSGASLVRGPIVEV